MLHACFSGFFFYHMPDYRIPILFSHLHVMTGCEDFYCLHHFQFCTPPPPLTALLHFDLCHASSCDVHWYLICSYLQITQCCFESCDDVRYFYYTNPNEHHDFNLLHHHKPYVGGIHEIEHLALAIFMLHGVCGPIRPTHPGAWKGNRAVITGNLIIKI